MASPVSNVVSVARAPPASISKDTVSRLWIAVPSSFSQPCRDRRVVTASQGKRLFKIFFIFIVLSDYGGLAAPIWFVTGREERLPAP